MHVLDGRSGGKEVKQDGRGDVVRQVSDHSKAAALAAQRDEVEFQRVDVMHAHILRIKARAELRRQVTVQLDDIEGARGLQQRFGQSAEARSDFHHGVSGFRRHGPQDPVDDRGLVKKMLSEPAPGSMWRLTHGKRFAPGHGGRLPDRYRSSRRSST